MIVIDGNIGVGKTSVLELLKLRNPEWHIFFEPVDKYEHAGGRNLLKEFYDKKSGSAFMFQLMALISNYQTYMSAYQMKGVRIVERGIWSSLLVFAETVYNKGEISGLELSMLKQVYSFLLLPPPSDREYIIFLDTSDTDVCLNRITRRNRNGENGIERRYWDLLNHEFRATYLFKSEKYRFRKVYTVNATDSLDLVVSNVEEIVADILNKIKRQ